jgi:citrate synthase
MVDQRRIDNQHYDSLAIDQQWMTAAEAATFLNVDRRTLYAYVSRGAVNSSPAPGGRARLYAVADLQRLKTRTDARLGHGAVAADALRWGQPVLDSSITEITDKGPAYRGYLLTDLIGGGYSFEQVAELLWQGYLPRAPIHWQATIPNTVDRQLPMGSVSGRLDSMMMLTLAAAQSDPMRLDPRPDAMMRIARQIIPMLACCAYPQQQRGSLAKLLQQPSVAAITSAALGASSDATRLIDQTLIALADHELNVSTFAARIAASADADTYNIVCAGLAVLSGTGHGAHSVHVEEFVSSIRRPTDVKAAIKQQRDRGLAMPGFGHTLYRDGDPRAVPLIKAALAYAPHLARIKVLEAVMHEMHKQQKPNVDFALVMISAALHLPPGSGAALFAIARTAGWIAHSIEQRTAGYLLRPRARFVGSALRSVSTQK